MELLLRKALKCTLLSTFSVPRSHRRGRPTEWSTCGVAETFAFMEIMRDQIVSATTANRILKLIQCPSFDASRLPKIVKSAMKVEDHYLPALVCRVVLVDQLINHSTL